MVFLDVEPDSGHYQAQQELWTSSWGCWMHKSSSQTQQAEPETETLPPSDTL